MVIVPEYPKVERPPLTQQFDYELLSSDVPLDSAAEDSLAGIVTPDNWDLVVVPEVYTPNRQPAYVSHDE